MNGEVRVAPISMRIENLDLGQLIRNFDSLRQEHHITIIPYSLSAYVDGKVVNFFLNYTGNRATVTMSSDDPNILDNLSKAVQQTFKGTSK
jgi:hypothetical protein